MDPADILGYLILRSNVRAWTGVVLLSFFSSTCKLLILIDADGGSYAPDLVTDMIPFHT